MRWKQRAVFVALLLVLVPGTGQAALIPIDPIVTVGTRTVTVGSNFPININVTGAVDLTSWQFNLKYDPSILQATLVTEGPFLASFGSNLFPPTVFTPGIIDNSSGLISLTANAFADLPPLPNGDGVLATVQFTALSQGFSTVEARNAFLNGLDSGFLVTPGSVTVVPLPSTAVLMGLGILLLWGISRWRSQTSVTT